MSCAPVFCVATIFTTNRFFGRREIETRVMLRPRLVSLRLPFTYTTTRTTRAPTGWCSLKEKRRVSTHFCTGRRTCAAAPGHDAPPTDTTFCAEMSRDELPSMIRKQPFGTVQPPVPQYEKSRWPSESVTVRDCPGARKTLL